VIQVSRLFALTSVGNELDVIRNEPEIEQFARHGKDPPPRTV
jgi:hypothetical protein